MSVRELIALGTSSQVPTRHRNHHGCFLRWDDAGFLFDPGDGTQRQLIFGNIAARDITRICITHFHGDHCLGLAGILQRLSLDRCPHPVYVHFPSSGHEFFDRLRLASSYYVAADIRPCPFEERSDGLQLLAETESYRLLAHKLDHSLPCAGYRLEEKVGRRFLPEKLAALGITGSLVGELSRTGRVVVHGREILVEEVSEEKQGSIFALVMDTRLCEGAFALARDADLLVMEATYTAEDQQLATDHGHASSVDAATVARQAGVKRLALTHFSQRYRDATQHLAEASAIFPESLVLADLDRVSIPRRR
jgi:ribonuclease Z